MLDLAEFFLQFGEVFWGKIGGGSLMSSRIRWRKEAVVLD